MLKLIIALFSISLTSLGAFAFEMTAKDAKKILSTLNQIGPDSWKQNDYSYTFKKIALSKENDGAFEVLFDFNINEKKAFVGPRIFSSSCKVEANVVEEQITSLKKNDFALNPRLFAAINSCIADAQQDSPLLPQSVNPDILASDKDAISQYMSELVRGYEVGIGPKVADIETLIEGSTLTATSHYLSDRWNGVLVAKFKIKNGKLHQLIKADFEGHY